MPLFERPPLETLSPIKERWTPIYLEHGRLEVDDSSIKWVGADGLLCRIPVATVCAILLGPGTTVTHAAVKACADSNTPVCWIGEGGLRFYAGGFSANHDNHNARHQAAVHADKRKREAVARKMFLYRFPNEDATTKSIQELRGMEGIRVRAQYAQMGIQFGVTWKGRNYDKSNWDLADGINRAISAVNASLYALCLSAVHSLGYIPSLGFVHDGGNIPFVYDLADLHKHQVALPAAFQAAQTDNAGQLEETARQLLKSRIEETRLLQTMASEIEYRIHIAKLGRHRVVDYIQGP